MSDVAWTLGSREAQVEYNVALVMDDFDRQLAEATDPMLIAAMRRARPQVEKIARLKAEEAATQAEAAMAGTWH